MPCFMRGKKTTHTIYFSLLYDEYEFNYMQRRTAAVSQNYPQLVANIMAFNKESLSSRFRQAWVHVAPEEPARRDNAFHSWEGISHLHSWRNPGVCGALWSLPDLQPESGQQPRALGSRRNHLSKRERVPQKQHTNMLVSLLLDSVIFPYRQNSPCPWAMFPTAGLSFAHDAAKLRGRVCRGHLFSCLDPARHQGSVHTKCP